MSYVPLCSVDWLVRASLCLANRPSLAGYWKFNTSLLEIRDFQERLESLVTGNKRWRSLKHRLRHFAIKYGRRLNLGLRWPNLLKINFPRRWKGDSLAVDLARRDFERKAVEPYKEYLVRSGLKRVPNKAVKCNAFAREEGVRRFPFPDGCVLWSNREMREPFRAHFRDHFGRCPDLPIQEFRSYLVDFTHLGEAEAASCEGEVSECEVHDTLKQVVLNKSTELDSLPYEVYLRLLHMFVPILTDMFNAMSSA